MPAKLCELRISDGSTFGSNGNDDNHLYLPKTCTKQVFDLLDHNEKIKLEWLPSFIFGGQKFADTIGNLSTSKDLLSRIIEVASGSGLTDVNLMKGMYFQSNGTKTISLERYPITGDDTTLYNTFGNMILNFYCDYEDGDNPVESVTLDPGDYLVLNSIEPGASGELMINWSVVNNTYPDAAEGVKGVVSLASVNEAMAGNNTTKAVTPAGVKLAINTLGYKHPAVSPSIGELNTLRTITGISLSADGNHIAVIETSDIATATYTNKGVVRNVTTAEAKSNDLTVYNEGYAVSAQVAKNMIDYWGKIDYFTSLSEANSSPVKNVAGKLVLVGV